MYPLKNVFLLHTVINICKLFFFILSSLFSFFYLSLCISLSLSFSFFLFIFISFLIHFVRLWLKVVSFDTICKPSQSII